MKQQNGEKERERETDNSRTSTCVSSLKGAQYGFFFFFFFTIVALWKPHVVYLFYEKTWQKSESGCNQRKVNPCAHAFSKKKKRKKKIECRRIASHAPSLAATSNARSRENTNDKTKLFFISLCPFKLVFHLLLTAFFLFFSIIDPLFSFYKIFCPSYGRV